MFNHLPKSSYFSLKRVKFVLVGAFFVGLVLGSAVPVGIVNAAAGLAPQPTYKTGGLLVSRPTPRPVVRFKTDYSVILRAFFEGMDQSLASLGRMVGGFFAEVNRALAVVGGSLQPTPKPKLVAKKPVAAPVAQKGVVLGIEDDVTDLSSRVAVLEGKEGSGETIVSLGSIELQGENLMRNSSFEVSDTDNAPRMWRYQLDSSTGNTFKSAEGIRSGKYGLKFLGGSHGGLGVSQPDTKLEPDRPYVLSLYVKAVDVGSVTLSFGFWDEVANARGTIKSVSYSGTKDWHRVSLVIDHSGFSGKGKKWFPLIEINNLGAGNIYIDDVQLHEGKVLSSYNSDLGDDAGTILGGGAVLVDNNGNLFPTKNGQGTLGTTDNKWNAITLSKASIDKDGSMTLDGNATLKGGVTLGDETSDTITFNGTVAGFTLTGSATYNDDVALSFGTGAPSSVLWETADANANELIVALPTGGSVDVPVLVIGDATVNNRDLGMFNGVTDPSLALISDDGGDYGRLYVTNAGILTITNGTDDIAITPTAAFTVTSNQGAADAISLVSSAGGIDISTGTGTAGNDIDILAGASINLTAAENAADAIVLSTNRGGIDISTGNDTNAIDILSGAALNLTTAVGGGQLAVTSNRSNAAALLLAALSGGIDISTGTGTAGNDIDLLAGASINLTARESVADAIVLSASSGGIDISTGGSTQDIDILGGDAINLTGAGQLALTSNQGAANALVLASTAGGIDISTGSGAAANDIDLLSGSSINLSAREGAADAVTIVALAGGIDISTGTGTAGRDIDILAGASINLTALENAADSIVLSTVRGGIDISTGRDLATSNNIDILAGNTLNTAINMQATGGGISMSGGTDTGNSSGIVLTGGQVNIYGDVKIDAIETATTNGVCHSGGNSDTTFANRTLVACSGAPADLAEWYETKPGVEAGDVVVMSGETIEFSYTPFDPFTGMQLVGATKTERVSVLKAAEKPYSPYVVGVVSTSPYQVIGAAIKDVAKNPQPIALSGRVPVKVTSENGPIEVGDYLTTSSTPGYAMKANKGGMVVGTALESFNGTTGMITVFVGRGYVADVVYEQIALLAALGASSESVGGGEVLGVTTAATGEASGPETGGVVAQTGVEQLASGAGPLPVVKAETVDELTVTTAAVFEGTLVVKGTATFEGVLTVNGVEVLADLNVSGAITQTFVAGENLNPGDAVAVVGEDTVAKGSPVVGVVATSAGAGQSVKVAIAGTVGGFSGLTAGQVVYAGDQAIGVARSATRMLVLPSLTNLSPQPTPEASPEPVAIPEPTPTLIPSPTPTPTPEISTGEIQPLKVEVVNLSSPSPTPVPAQ